MRRLWSFAGSVLFLLLAWEVSADEAPDWLRQAAAATHDAFEPRVPAVVLLEEGHLGVGPDGRVRFSLRRAVKILTREGRDAAVAQAFYQTDSSNVVEMRGWLLLATGAVRSYDRKDAVDVAVVDNDLYNEARFRVLAVQDLAEPGAVFGYEYTVDERPLFAQRQWWFQDRLPVLRSTLDATLPPGWRIEGQLFNASKVSEPGESHWEMRNLAYLPPEPASPSLPSLAPRLALSYFPPPGTETEGRNFAGWSNVAAWMHDLSEGQADLSPALSAKAAELVRTARTERERMAAIGRFVQSLRYVSVQIGVGRFRPHPATEVLAKAYGDCKDKANLMRALLRAAGIESWLVLVYAGDRAYVRESWPSPTQFNHCILAIRVAPSIEGGAVVAGSRGGRLLFFDPTDSETALGDLPDHEQGSLALVADPDGGGLVRLPELPPLASRVDRTVSAVIDAEGGIRATLRERAGGQAAARQRRWLRAHTAPELAQSAERWIAERASGARLASVAPADAADDRSEVVFVFTAPRYAKAVSHGLVVLRPAVASRRDAVVLKTSRRQFPLLLPPESYFETAEFELPPGVVVDEVPAPVRLETPLGRFTAAYEATPGKLRFTRELSMPRTVVPVQDYAVARRFLEAVDASDDAVVVLAAK